MLRNYHKKVNNAEQRKIDKQNELIAQRREVEKIKKENLEDNHRREERKMMMKKMNVINKGE